MLKEKLRKQTGITLIALIITIIVMLILVGVSVTVALNGGLFTTAKGATTRTQIELEREQLLSAILGATGENGRLDLSKLSTNLPEGFEEVEGEATATTRTYVSKNGNKYVVDKNRKITYVGNQDSSGGSTDEVNPTGVPEELIKYILGADGKGRGFANEIFDEATATFLQDPEEPNSTMHEKVRIAYYVQQENEDEEKLYITYNRGVYKFRWEKLFDSEDRGKEFYGTGKTLEGTLEKVSDAPEGNLGKYVEYAGTKWIVLREDETGVELITAEITDTELALGNSDYEASRISYNNAVDILVSECKKVCKDKYGIEVGENVLSIRSVGGPEIDETKNTDTVDFTKLTKFKPQSGFSYANFAGTTEEKGYKIADDNYLDDYYQMKKLGILVVPGEHDYTYWCASRSIYESSDEVSFEIVCIDGMWEIYEFEGVEYEFVENPGLWVRIVDNDGSGSRRAWERAIRPVIKLKPGILDSATETGLMDDPIKLD